MEPRLLLAADVATALDGGHLPSEAELFLPGGISGSVFATTDAGGARQVSDSGIGGVRLELLDADGDVLAEAFTNLAGEYEFPALTPGVYGVREVQPAGFDDLHVWMGPGGGQLVARDLVTEIVVSPGSRLVGYDFAERSQAMPAELVDTLTFSLARLFPSPSIEWRRAANAVRAPAFESNFVARLAPAPLVMRIDEPIFGGSSQSLGDARADTAGSAVLRSADVEEFAADIPADNALAGGHRLAANDRDEARERAFELHADAGENESQPLDDASTPEPVTAPRVAPSPRIVKQPAA